MNETSFATQPAPANSVGDTLSGAEWSQIREALRGLRYGSVSVIVQDGVVVQIDRIEKRRVRRNDSGDQR